MFEELLALISPRARRKLLKAQDRWRIAWKSEEVRWERLLCGIELCFIKLLYHIAQKLVLRGGSFGESHTHSRGHAFGFRALRG